MLITTLAQHNEANGETHEPDPGKIAPGERRAIVVKPIKPAFQTVTPPLLVSSNE